MSTPAPDGAVVEVEALAEALVAAVIRPEDAEHARATIDRVGPTDLAALIAVVDDHQPMTIEVVVDVLAELGCPPTTIADAVAADLDDVHVLLGIDPSPPPSALDDGPRVIDLGGTPPGIDDARETSTHVARDAEPTPEDDATNGEPDAHAVVDGVEGDEVAPRDDRTPADDPTVVVIGGTDEPSEVETSDGDAPGLDTADAPTSDTETSGVGRRAIWALVSFIVLVGGALALAAYLGAFG